MGRARSDFEGGCGSVRGLRDTCAGEKRKGTGSGKDDAEEEKTRRKTRPAVSWNGGVR